MPGARKASYFLAAYILGFVLIYVTPAFTHRRDFDRAFFAYYKDPTPENESALRAPQRINESVGLGLSAVGALIFFALGYSGYAALQSANHVLKRMRASNSQP